MLSDTTAKLVENYLSRYRSYAVGTDPLITNRYQHKIDRDGISYIVKKYADALRKEDAINALAPKVADETNLPDWNKDKDLLQFLNSLK